MHSNKRIPGEPYLTPPSSNMPRQALSRRSSSSLLKKSSTSSTSTTALVMSRPPQGRKRSKSKGGAVASAQGRDSYHVEIVQDADDETPSGTTTTTNTEKYMRRRTPVSGKEVDDAQNDHHHHHHQNQNPIEPFTEEISKEIALAVAMIVAEYEMMKRQESKKASLSPNDSQTKEEVVIGENTVIPSASTVSSAISQLHFDSPDVTQNVSSIRSGKSSLLSQSSWKTPPTPSRSVKMGGNAEVHRYLNRVQHFMNSLGYHRDGEPEIKINVRLSMKMQMITAKELIRAALPIKCLHAVVLAVYLTNCIDSVERFPIYFRSHVGGKEYKHIVLGIYVQGHFGALGISRDKGLQDKSTTYSKLSDLVFEFAKCYDESGHTLNEVKFGQIITHDQNSLERLFSKIGLIPISGCSHAEIEVNVEKFAKQLRAKMGLACLRSPQSPAPLTRMSRSRTSMNTSGYSTVCNNSSLTTACRARALSMGPTPSASRRTSEEKLGKNAKSKSKSIRK